MACPSRTAARKVPGPQERVLNGLFYLSGFAQNKVAVRYARRYAAATKAATPACTSSITFFLPGPLDFRSIFPDNMEDCQRSYGGVTVCSATVGAILSHRGK